MESNENKALITDKGTVVIDLTKALFEGKIETVFDVIGNYLDKNELKVSEEMITSYRRAGRIADRKIIPFSTKNNDDG